MSSVCPSVHQWRWMKHNGWKSWKRTAQTISPTSSLFVAQRSSTYSQGNMEKFGGKNVRSTPTSIMSSWIESTESHMILGGGVAVCLILSAHHAVIFAIAQLSCCIKQFMHPQLNAHKAMKHSIDISHTYTSIALNQAYPVASWIFFYKCFNTTNQDFYNHR